MRHGQIEMIQDINGNKQKWRWSHIHYQMCKKTNNVIWSMTNSSNGVISYNEVIPFGFILNDSTVTTGTVTGSNLQGCKLVVELNITSTATINLVSSSIYPNTIEFTNSITFDERILTDTITRPYYISNWITQTLTEVDPNTGTVTGETADLSILQNGNNYSIIIENYTGSFNFDDLLFQYCLQSVSLGDFIPYNYTITISLQR